MIIQILNRNSVGTRMALSVAHRIKTAVVWEYLWQSIDVRVELGETGLAGPAKGSARPHSETEQKLAWGGYCFNTIATPLERGFLLCLIGASVSSLLPLHSHDSTSALAFLHSLPSQIWWRRPHRVASRSHWMKLSFQLAERWGRAGLDTRRTSQTCFSGPFRWTTVWGRELKITRFPASTCFSCTWTEEAHICAVLYKFASVLIVWPIKGTSTYIHLGQQNLEACFWTTFLAWKVCFLIYFLMDSSVAGSCPAIKESAGGMHGPTYRPADVKSEVSHWK